MVAFWKEFKGFIKEYKVVTVAVAFVMGQAVNDLVKSFVNQIFMPILNPLIPDGDWKTAVFKIGSIHLGWGPFLSSLIYFVILSFVVFLLVKKLLKQSK